MTITVVSMHLGQPTTIVTATVSVGREEKFKLVEGKWLKHPGLARDTMVSGNNTKTEKIAVEAHRSHPRIQHNGHWGKSAAIRGNHSTMNRSNR